MARRVIAALLCAAMVFSSESFSVAASTAPIVTEVQAEYAEESTEELKKQEELPVEDKDLGAENDSEDKQDADDGGISSEEAGTDQNISEDQDDQEIDANEGDVSEELMVMEDGTLDELLTNEALTEYTAASGCFEVDSAGVLLLKEGEIMPHTPIIPKTAKRIPAGIFNKSNLTISKVLFEKDSELEVIDANAFEGSQLTEIEIPAGVTAINEYTFRDARNLKKVTFKGGVSSIGEEAFKNTSIVNITAPALTQIGRRAFENCKKLTTFDAGNLEQINDYAFYECTLLKSFTWSVGLQKIGESAFYGCGFTSLKLGGVESETLAVGSSVFEACASLVKVESLPRKMQTVSYAMFKDCKKLTSVTFSTEVTTIDSQAFAGCIGISWIAFPESVKAFMPEAFARCTGLETIIFRYPNPDAADFVIDDKAFPLVSSGNHLMKGFDGKVQDYAESRGYKYETLYSAYDIVCPGNEKMKVELSHKKALPGTIVTVSFMPGEGYTLEDSVLLRCDTCDAPDIELVAYTEQVILYRFKMPAGNVNVLFSVKERGKAISGAFSLQVDPLNGSIPVEDENGVIHIKKVGQEAQISVKDNNENSIGAWLVDFKSSDTKVITVSSKGTLLAKKKGTATVTVTKKDNAENSKKLKIEVDNDTVISDIKIVGLDTDDSIDISRANIVKKGEAEYPVISFNTTALKNKAISFDLSIRAYEEGDTTHSYIVSSTWKSVDAGVASLASQNRENNSNTITVKKGAFGESMITITVMVQNGTEKISITKEVLIRVIDATPRIADSSITVNKASDIGTYIDIVPVYGYDIKSQSMEIVIRTSQNGVDNEEPFDYLTVIDKGAGVYCLKGNSDKPAVGATLKYTKGSLYISGKFINESSFLIPLPEVTIINKALSPSIKLAGKINLFYYGSDESAGEITLTQSLTKETVKEDGYKLLSEENGEIAKKGETPNRPDLFADNFQIEKVNNTTFKIKRKDDKLKCDEKGKPVVSGYIAIHYDGYTSPVYQKIKIPTENKKPSYVLSMTSATVNENNKGLTFPLQILDKKTKKPVILDGATIVLDERPNTSTSGVFDNDLSTVIADDNSELTIIPLKLRGAAASGKAVINVRLGTWSDVLSFTFKLAASKSAPKVKLSPAELTLNARWDGEAETTLILNSKLNPIEETNVTRTLSDLTYIAKGSSSPVKPAALDIDVNGDTITAKWIGESGASGKYKFSITPHILYGGIEGGQLKDITFQVVIKNTQPSLKLKSSTFVLNAKYPGREEAKIAYQLVNLPVGSNPEFVTSEMQINKVKTNAPDGDKLLDMDFDQENGVVTAKLKTPLACPKPFTYEYWVEGLQVKANSFGEPVTLQKFKVKIQGKNADPTITLKAKGTLNPVDPSSGIVYTSTVKGINGAIDSVEAAEFDSMGKLMESLDHFEMLFDKDTQQVTLKAKPGVVMDANVKGGYTVRLIFKLEVMDEVTTSQIKDVVIKPKQSIPKVKVDKTSAFFYAGQNKEKTVQVIIEKTGKDALYAEDAEVVFADGTDDSIKKAFKIESVSPVTDPATGITTTTMTLKLVNSTLLVLNKKYTLNFEVKYNGQMDHTKGSAFKLDVTVRK